MSVEGRQLWEKDATRMLVVSWHMSVSRFHGLHKTAKETDHKVKMAQQ